jgi:hypothetical protein
MTSAWCTILQHPVCLHVCAECRLVRSVAASAASAAAPPQDASGGVRALVEAIQREEVNVHVDVSLAVKVACLRFRHLWVLAHVVRPPGHELGQVAGLMFPEDRPNRQAGRVAPEGFEKEGALANAPQRFASAVRANVTDQAPISFHGNC